MIYVIWQAGIALCRRSFNFHKEKTLFSTEAISIFRLHWKTWLLIILSPHDLCRLYTSWWIPPTFRISLQHIFTGEECFIIFLYQPIMVPPNLRSKSQICEHLKSADLLAQISRSADLTLRIWLCGLLTGPKSGISGYKCITVVYPKINRSWWRMA